jgi:4-diphosphocytidyl-2-C-methyl-D-erythritol kinase
MPSPHGVFVLAYAKINLTLAVLGERTDGYHRLASVMQTISLHDTLRIEATSGGEITCVTDVPELRTPENLAYRAAALLQAECDASDRGARIELSKTVPAQAGLGGGSSDAACVLTTLNRLWDLSLSPGRLADLGAQLGSDIPFFIHGGTALIEGRGESVTPLPDAEPLWLVLVKPPISVSTAAAFGALTPTGYGTEAETEALVGSIRQGKPLAFELLSNSLERSILASYPEVREAYDALRQAGAPVVRMSGSGPTLYAPFRRLIEASYVYTHVRASRNQTWLCHTIGRAMLDTQPRPDAGLP